MVVRTGCNSTIGNMLRHAMRPANFLTATDSLVTVRKEKNRKDCAFRRQFKEKPSIIPGCPGSRHGTYTPLAKLIGVLNQSTLQRTAIYYIYIVEDNWT